MSALERVLCSAVALPPAHRRVVVVRAGVDDAVARVVVRPEIRRLRIGPERKLEDRHSGESELLAQRFDLRRDDAEVLRDERQLLVPEAPIALPRRALRPGPSPMRRCTAVGASRGTSHEASKPRK